MHKLIDVPYIDQTVKYPTGCESISAVMLLQHLGVEITPEEFIDNCLEKQEFEERDGVLYGPNPYKYFVGSPYDSESFGCYAPVLCNALDKVIGDRYEIVDETGKDLEELVQTYIDKDMPVVLWACINMREPIVGPFWKLLESGEDFTWISNEHCMLMVGYDDENYIFNDPWENNGVIGYPKDVVKDRYEAQHMQAIGLTKK